MLQADPTRIEGNDFRMTWRVWLHSGTTVEGQLYNTAQLVHAAQMKRVEAQWLDQEGNVKSVDVPCRGLVENLLPHQIERYLLYQLVSMHGHPGNIGCHPSWPWGRTPDLDARGPTIMPSEAPVAAPQSRDAIARELGSVVGLVKDVHLEEDEGGNCTVRLRLRVFSISNLKAVNLALRDAGLGFDGWEPAVIYRWTSNSLPRTLLPLQEKSREQHWAEHGNRGLWAMPPHIVGWRAYQVEHVGSLSPYVCFYAPGHRAADAFAWSVYKGLNFPTKLWTLAPPSTSEQSS